MVLLADYEELGLLGIPCFLTVCLPIVIVVAVYAHFRIRISWVATLVALVPPIVIYLVLSYTFSPSHDKAEQRIASGVAGICFAAAVGIGLLKLVIRGAAGDRGQERAAPPERGAPPSEAPLQFVKCRVCRKELLDIYVENGVCTDCRKSSRLRNHGPR